MDMLMAPEDLPNSHDKHIVDLEYLFSELPELFASLVIEYVKFVLKPLGPLNLQVLAYL